MNFTIFFLKFSASHLPKIITVLGFSFFQFFTVYLPPFPSGKWIESFAYDKLHFWPWGWSLLDGDNFNILMMKRFSEMVDHRKCSLWPSQISWHFSSKIWTCAKPKFWFCWMNLFCRLANESSSLLFTGGTIIKVLSSFQFAICYRQIPTWSEPLLK